MGIDQNAAQKLSWHLATVYSNPVFPNPQRRAMRLQSSFWIVCLITWLNWQSVMWELFILQSF